MRSRPMRLQSRFVPVDLVEVVDVLVLGVLKNVEAHTAGSSRSEPRASTSIAFRKRSRPSGFTRTFTQIASIVASLLSDRRISRARQRSGTIRRAPYADSRVGVARKRVSQIRPDRTR